MKINSMLLSRIMLKQSLSHLYKSFTFTIKAEITWKVSKVTMRYWKPTNI